MKTRLRSIAFSNLNFSEHRIRSDVKLVYVNIKFCLQLQSKLMLCKSLNEPFDCYSILDLLMYKM